MMIEEECGQCKARALLKRTMEGIRSLEGVPITLAQAAAVRAVYAACDSAMRELEHWHDIVDD